MWWLRNIANLVFSNVLCPERVHNCSSHCQKIWSVRKASSYSKGYMVPHMSTNEQLNASKLSKHVHMQLLHTGLKRGKFDTLSKEQLGMLDPFIPLLVKSLSSRHIKVLSRVLQCLVWTIRLPLPSLGSHINEISTHVFGLLRRYARTGSAVGSNRELVHSAFKVRFSLWFSLIKVM